MKKQTFRYKNSKFKSPLKKNAKENLSLNSSIPPSVNEVEESLKLPNEDHLKNSSLLSTLESDFKEAKSTSHTSSLNDEAHNSNPRPSNFQTPKKSIVENSSLKSSSEPKDKSAYTTPISKRIKLAQEKHTPLSENFKSPMNSNISKRSSTVLSLSVKKREHRQELRAIKDKINLLKTASSILSNNKISSLHTLTTKWKEVLSTASEELFELVEPKLKDQYQAEAALIDQKADKSSLERNSYENSLSSENSICSENSVGGDDKEESLYEFMLKTMGIDKKLL
ncbi:hypothetical protein BB560_006762 [Smittium megazygosporum]|uniref:Uncharacterized protein n=1 Tax=Smittium megazygosporum TaxID=133381 RepID=A0A2T9Y1T2_9FUNG|nr:hypothetical protein BB560_006762 [Smittium megazygosporum]